MIYLYNDGVDDNDNGNDNGIIDDNDIDNDIIEYIELEDDNIGTDDIDISEDLYLTSFLPSKIIISSRYQMI
jgi:hypothetical protein